MAEGSGGKRGAGERAGDEGAMGSGLRASGSGVGRWAARSCRCWMQAFRRWWPATCQVSCHRSLHTALQKREHGIHIGAFPSHAAAFQARLNHQLVRTFHHPGTDGPPGLPKERRAHQSEPFARNALRGSRTSSRLISASVKRSARRRSTAGPRCLRRCKQRLSMRAGKTRPPELKASNTWLTCSAAKICHQNSMV
jgi:hypothetical protein